MDRLAVGHERTVGYNTPYCPVFFFRANVYRSLRGILRSPVPRGQARVVEEGVVRQRMKPPTHSCPEVFSVAFSILFSTVINLAENDTSQVSQKGRALLTKSY
jgi:hypothetical protein